MKACSKKICCKRPREDVISNLMEDKNLNISREHIITVLPDWEKIMKNYKRVSVEIFLNLLSENPQYKNLFPAFANIPNDRLIYNRCFRVHAEAMLKGINSVFDNFSVQYETHNEILPAIAYTHNRRNITKNMMARLKESMVYVCTDFLNLTRRKKIAWMLVFDYVFDNYICSAYPLGGCCDEGMHSKRKLASRMSLNTFHRKSMPLI